MSFTVTWNNRDRITIVCPCNTRTNSYRTGYWSGMGLPTYVYYFPTCGHCYYYSMWDAEHRAEMRIAAGWKLSKDIPKELL